MPTTNTWQDVAPALRPRAGGSPRAVALAALAALVVAALAALALGRMPLNLYDVSFELDWGRELIHGQLPDVRVVGASTPHPLSILFGAIAALSGGGALDVMRAVVYLAAGSTVVALVALGRASRSWAVGVIAALALVVSEPLVFGTLGQATASDLPSLAAVVGALALEVRRPRRGAAPLAVLALAGLWRPEAWLLSGAYLLYAGRGRDRAGWARLAALALSAPLLWAVGDLVLTGNPLYSLTYTHASTAVAQRPTGLRRAPAELWSTLTGYFNTPILVGAICGLAIDLIRRRLPRLLTVGLALTVLGFAGLGAAGLPLNARYALPTIMLLALYFGFFVAGWRSESKVWLRRAWMAAALAVAALALASVPSNMRALAADRAALAAQARIPGELQSLARRPGVRPLLARCGPVQVSYRVMPLLAYALGRDPRTIAVVDQGVPAGGSVIEPAPGLPARLFETQAHPLASLTGRGYRLVASNSSWMIYSRCE